MFGAVSLSASACGCQSSTGLDGHVLASPLLYRNCQFVFLLLDDHGLPLLEAQPVQPLAMQPDLRYGDPPIHSRLRFPLYFKSPRLAHGRLLVTGQRSGNRLTNLSSFKLTVVPVCVISYQ